MQNKMKKRMGYSKEISPFGANEIGFSNNNSSTEEVTQSGVHLTSHSEVHIGNLEINQKSTADVDEIASDIALIKSTS